MISSLYDKCFEFQKLADCESPKMSVEKNSNPILQELSEIKSFDDRIKFAKKLWGKPLGEGSSRTAFQLNDELIIKIAHNDRGLAQNKVEMKPDIQTDCVNNAVVADSKGKWIIFRATKDITKEEFRKLVGFGFDHFMNALFYAMNNESSRWSEPRDFEDLKDNSLFMCLSNLVFENQLLVGDIDKISSWSTLDGKPVLRDAGLDKKTYEKYYADSSSSSSSSTTKTSE